ncbi:MAG: MFS transporter, partial [Candidatus Acidiferrum sp.]
GPSVKWFGERKSLYIGLTFGALGFALFGWAPTGWLFLAAIPVNALWGLATPASQSMMTQCVSPSEQGELQGAVSSLRGLGMIFGPGIFSATFAACIAPGRWFPGGPWYLAAILLVAALVVALKVTGGAEIPGSSRLAEENAAG